MVIKRTNQTTTKAKAPAKKKTVAKTALPPVGSAEYKAMVLRGDIKE